MRMSEIGQEIYIGGGGGEGNRHPWSDNGPYALTQRITVV